MHEIPIILLSRTVDMGPWFIVAAIVSYVAVIGNVFVFVVFCQKPFLTPATVLLQGLALADGLTAVFMYGFEPIFLNTLSEITVPSFNGSYVTLQSSACSIYVYTMLLACDCFHLISVFFTTCIGLQKVVAVRFPIWTRNNLTVKKSLVCCVLYFAIPAAINVPLLNAHSFRYEKLAGQESCLMNTHNEFLEDYYHEYQPLITSAIFILMCLTMMISSVYITYKLCTNKFKKYLTKDETRSILMVFVLLFAFLISEIPRIVGNITYFVTIRSIRNTMDEFTYRLISGSQLDRKFFSFLFAIRTDPSSLNFSEKDLTTARTFFEFVKFITVLACLCNILIYMTMSKKIRTHLKGLVFKTKHKTSRSFKSERNEVHHICTSFCSCKLNRKYSQNAMILYYPDGSQT